MTWSVGDCNINKATKQDNEILDLTILSAQYGVLFSSWNREIWWDKSLKAILPSSNKTTQFKARVLGCCHILHISEKS